MIPNYFWQIVSHLVCQSASLPVFQPDSQLVSPTSLSVRQPVRQSVCHSVSQSIRQSVSQAASESDSQLVSRSDSQPVSQSVNQSGSLSVSQTASQSVSLADSCSGCWSCVLFVNQSVRQEASHWVNQSGKTISKDSLYSFFLWCMKTVWNLFRHWWQRLISMKT